MTREEVKKMLPVMQAYAEGGVVQVNVQGHWEDLDEPEFESYNEYRVKPANGWYQRLADQFHWWIAMDSSGEVYAYSARPRVNYSPGSNRWLNDKGDYFFLSGHLFPDRPKFEGDWDKTLVEPDGRDDRKEQGMNRKITEGQAPKSAWHKVRCAGDLPSEEGREYLLRIKPDRYAQEYYYVFDELYFDDLRGRFYFDYDRKDIDAWCDPEEIV